MFINEIVVELGRQMRTKNRLTSNRNTIFLYSKGNAKLNEIYEPYRSKKPNGTYRYYKEKYGIEKAEEIWKRGRLLSDIWFSTSTVNSKLYPTEKPFKLLERIILLSTKGE